MSQSKLPDSLLTALLQYEAHLRTTLPQKKADALWAQVRTALWRYTLPGWGAPLPQGQRLSPAEYEQGLQLLQELPVERLQDAPMAQERLFEQLAVAGNSQRNYRWALHQLINWCQQQSWLAEGAGSLRRANTPKRQRKPSADQLHLTTRRGRKPHRLANADQSEALQQELDLFVQYLTAPGLGGTAPKVSASTAKQYVNQVLRILGWLHSEQGVGLQELSVHQLIEGHADALNQEPEETTVGAAMEPATGWIAAYLKWLRTPTEEQLKGSSEGVQSPHTDIQVIKAWRAVAHFLYDQAPASDKRQAVKAEAAIAALETVQKQANVRLKQHQPVSDPLQKQLEWHEFLELVEQLRHECVPRFSQSTQSKQGGTTLAPPRSLTAIAHSYQRFLLAALLAYIPPQRPQVLRKLVIAQSPGQNQAHPPQKVLSGSSVLYQVQETWWIDVVEQKNNRSSAYSVAVPNLVYADGRCFYQYLEEWLQHYVYQDPQGQENQVPGLRSCFNPDHPCLFTMKNGQPYADSPAFIKLLRHPAYRLSEKALDFRSVRLMYAKYLQQKEGVGVEFKDSEAIAAGTAIPPVLHATDVEQDCAYNPEDWQQAAEIAQKFLNQVV